MRFFTAICTVPCSVFYQKYRYVKYTTLHGVVLCNVMFFEVSQIRALVARASDLYQLKMIPVLFWVCFGRTFLYVLFGMMHLFHFFKISGIPFRWEWHTKIFLCTIPFEISFFSRRVFATLCASVMHFRFRTEQIRVEHDRERTTPVIRKSGDGSKKKNFLNVTHSIVNGYHIFSACSCFLSAVSVQSRYSPVCMYTLSSVLLNFSIFFCMIPVLFCKLIYILYIVRRYINKKRVKDIFMRPWLY